MRFNKIKIENKETYQNFKKLYFQAFPKEERRPLLLLWLYSKMGRIDIFELEKNSKFVGFIIIAKQGDIVFIDYLAISPECRGMGLGSEVLEHMKEHYSSSRIFLEVETPIKEEDNYHQRIKRVSFYKQNGFQSTNLRVTNFDCDFTILSYNGKIKFQEYLALTKSTYGMIVYYLSQIQKIDSTQQLQTNN